MINLNAPAKRPTQSAQRAALLVLSALIAALALTACNQATVGQSPYREVSAISFNPAPPNQNLNFQQSSGGIPPLTWRSGSVSSIACNPRSFDPVVGQTSTLTISLSQPAHLLRVTVINSLNATVRTLYNQQAAAGNSSFTWDGKDSSGQNARYTIYSFRVVAFNNKLSEIGRGQAEVITYRPKAGVSLQNADKYNNTSGEFTATSDEWVAAGLTNPRDTVQVFFDNSPAALANSELSGLFRSAPFSYSPGAHTVKVRVFPFNTQTSYDIDYSVYLNRLHFLGLTVLLNGSPVQHDFSYFIPANNEVAQVAYSLDAAEDQVFMYVSYIPPTGSDPILHRTVNLGAKGAGPHFTAWDGKNDLGVLCAPGKYCISTMTGVDPAAAQFRPAALFITKYINIQEAGQ